MQADIDKLVRAWFTGAMVNMLLEIDQEKYKDYVMIERGSGHVHGAAQGSVQNLVGHPFVLAEAVQAVD